MDRAKLRAWWSHRQGLDGSMAGKSAADVLAAAGWARSAGGAGPYLGLFARAGISREAADRAAATLDIHELPSARGCTYVLPACDFALGLKVGQPFSGAEMKLAAKLGVSEAEVDQLCQAVVSALGKGPLDPDQLKEAVGGAARSLGPEGVKKGLGNTLPLAFERLQSSGDIRRVPVNGRLDQQRYRYALWRPNPLAEFPAGAGEARTELARRYFRWIGPATMAEFQWFSGLGVKAAKEAVAPLDLTALDQASGRLMFPGDLESYQQFHIPKKPDYRLVSSLDGIFPLRRDLSLLLEDEKAVQAAGGVADLPSHAILDRGRIAGLWEYDPASESIAWSSFVPVDRALKEAVARAEQFVREQLGDARSFSLDSPKSRQPRIEALRRAAPV